jgi:hypothetical protein
MSRVLDGKGPPPVAPTLLLLGTTDAVTRRGERGLKGTPPANLRKFLAFYEAYPEIQQTVSVESEPAPVPRLETQQCVGAGRLFQPGRPICSLPNFGYRSTRAGIGSRRPDGGKP